MKCGCNVDFLTFSVSETDPDLVIRSWLHLDPALFTDREFGFNSYPSSKVFGSIVRGYRKPGEEWRGAVVGRGCCLSLSGNGCRELEEYSDMTFPALLLKLGREEDAHVSRIDLAMDDYSGFLDMGEIEECIYDGAVRSRIRDFNRVDPLKRRKNGMESKGKTLYLGSESSSFRIRIYDKAAQMGQESHWIRVEMVFRDRQCAGVLSGLCELDKEGTCSLGILAGRILNDKLQFIELDDKNISRCSVLQWWSDFIEEVEKIVVFTSDKAKHEIEKTLSWVRRQVAPALYVLASAMGFGTLVDIASSGSTRISDDQKVLIRDYLSKSDEDYIRKYQSGAEFAAQRGINLSEFDRMEKQRLNRMRHFESLREEAFEKSLNLFRDGLFHDTDGYQAVSAIPL